MNPERADLRLTAEQLAHFHDSVQPALDGEGEDLRTLLVTGRKMRLLSGKNSHFWDASQRALHRRFDAIYAQGLERLAETTFDPKEASLQDRLTPTITLTEAAKKAQGAAAIGLGGFGGWLMGHFLWARPTLSEFGQGYEYTLSHPSIDHYPELHSGSKLLDPFKENNFSPSSPDGREVQIEDKTKLTPPKNLSQLITLGKELSMPNHQDLYDVGKILGTELLLNTLLGALGILAIKSKQRFLGSALLGFALAAHLGAYHDMRQFQDNLISNLQMRLLDTLNKGSQLGEALSSDLPTQSVESSKEFETVNRELQTRSSEVFHLLNIGYLLCPFVILGTLALLILNSSPDIPKELVLTRMLSQKDLTPEVHRELGQILTEIEIEFDEEKKSIETLGEGKAALRKRKLLAGKIFRKLQHKVKENRITAQVFKQTEKAMQKEIKGELAARLPKTYRLRVVASMSAFVAYALSRITKEVFPTFTALINAFLGIFIAAQGICLILDGIRTVSDLGNERLTGYVKVISVLRLFVSTTTFVLMCLALFVPPFSPLFLPILLTSVLVGLGLGYLQNSEMKRLATLYDHIADTPAWNGKREEVRELCEISSSFFKQRVDESSEEYRLRLQEFEEGLQWIEAQVEGCQRGLIKEQRQETLRDLLQAYSALIQRDHHLKKKLFMARYVTSHLPKRKRSSESLLVNPVS